MGRFAVAAQLPLFEMTLRDARDVVVFGLTASVWTSDEALADKVTGS